MQAPRAKDTGHTIAKSMCGRGGGGRRGMLNYQCPETVGRSHSCLVVLHDCAQAVRGYSRLRQGCQAGMLVLW